ncbi:head completion/stabilization protein [Paracidovorax konjaci]|uniref:Phage head completion protein (GPL) n=1 Tax=Paracidovorax konjaci TaxID=32040 RepID=A0A1I1XUI8_9BURK|nr:head completion/stabilization protein [Paracidovorax konjaci]SFE10328.1 Phage head completion protein (GPL) [Paracidovorax konjaci]
MSFIATANPPARGVEPAVANDGWFPDIDREQLRADIRLDGTSTIERLQLALEAAMATVNAELQTWAAEQRAAGHASLAEVPAPHIGRKSIKVMQYRSAIYAHVQAALAEAYRDMDTLPQGDGKGARVMAALEGRVEGFQQQLRWAIADVQSRPRVIAELL